MTNQLMFVTYLATADCCRGFNLLLESLRAFGGELRDAPWLVFGEQDVDRDEDLRGDEGVSFEELSLPDDLPEYPFTRKVFALARAEALYAGKGCTITWVDTNVMIVNQPLMYRLEEPFQAALLPVHIRNVGLPADEPLNDYWRGIYQACGIEDVTTSVTSFIDQQTIRAYYNTHAFSIDPALGLLQAWQEVFVRLVTDRAYQERCCGEIRERIFLFQAVLSALLFKHLQPAQIRLLPPTYNYPYNLHDSVPMDRRPRSLGELVSLTYEGRDLKSATDIEIEERYRDFLHL